MKKENYKYIIKVFVILILTIVACVLTEINIFLW